MGGKHERLMDRAPSCPLPLLMVAIAGLGRRGWVGGRDGEGKRSQAGHGSFLERVKNFIRGPFLFSVCEYTSFPLSGRKRGGVWLHKVWEAGPGAPFPSLRLLAGLVVLRPRAKALCVLQEGAHGWLVDDE